MEINTQLAMRTDAAVAVGVRRVVPAQRNYLLSFAVAMEGGDYGNSKCSIMRLNGTGFRLM